MDHLLVQVDAELLQQHRTALADARRVLTSLRTADMSAPTPCEHWDLRALLGHVVGQNAGFAAAIATGDAAADEYAPRPPDTAAAALAAWDASVADLVGACATAPADRPVRLVEVSPSAPLQAATAVRMQLLDTVVHTWDVATALGTHYRPDDAVVAAVADIARRVPDGPARTAAGAAFGPPMATASDDPWEGTLARLGRAP